MAGKGRPNQKQLPFFTEKEGSPFKQKSALPSRKRRGARSNKKLPFFMEKEGGARSNTKTAPPRGRTEENLFAKIQLLPGRAVSALLGLNSMWNQTSGAIKWVDRFKFCSSNQLCAPSVKLYVGLSSLSEIFLASWGMKLIISSVPPDMRFSRRRFLRFAGQPAFPACPYHLGHMVIGVALADSISAFEVIALIVHWSFLPCEIALKLHRFTCTLE